jgi:hypothetical protein
LAAVRIVLCVACPTGVLFTAEAGTAVAHVIGLIPCKDVAEEKEKKSQHNKFSKL